MTTHFKITYLTYAGAIDSMVVQAPDFYSITITFHMVPVPVDRFLKIEKVEKSE